MGTVTLHHGDALAVLRTLPDCSIDAVVCDPPYGLAEHKPATIVAAMTAWCSGDRDHVPDGARPAPSCWRATPLAPPCRVACLVHCGPGGPMAGESAPTAPVGATTPEESPMSQINPADRPAAYQARLDDAARRACDTYLDAVGMEPPARRFAEYDSLTGEGRAAWQRIVLRAVYDMLPVIRDHDRVGDELAVQAAAQDVTCAQPAAHRCLDCATDAEVLASLPPFPGGAR